MRRHKMYYKCLECKQQQIIPKSVSHCYFQLLFNGTSRNVWPHTEVVEMKSICPFWSSSFSNESGNIGRNAETQTATEITNK